MYVCVNKISRLLSHTSQRDSYLRAGSLPKKVTNTIKETNTTKATYFPNVPIVDQVLAPPRDLVRDVMRRSVPAQSGAYNEVVMDSSHGRIHHSPHNYHVLVLQKLVNPSLIIVSFSRKPKLSLVISDCRLTLGSAQSAHVITRNKPSRARQLELNTCNSTYSFNGSYGQ